MVQRHISSAFSIHQSHCDARLAANALDHSNFHHVSGLERSPELPPSLLFFHHGTHPLSTCWVCHVFFNFISAIIIRRRRRQARDFLTVCSSRVHRWFITDFTLTFSCLCTQRHFLLLLLLYTTLFIKQVQGEQIKSKLTWETHSRRLRLTVERLSIRSGCRRRP